MSTVESVPRTRTHHHQGWWWKTLLAGLVLWAITIWVTALTKNTNLIPTLILLGSFLVPFCVVLFVLERVSGNITTIQVIVVFFVSGICGVLGASLLEAGLTPTFWTYIGVGFIEEFVKGALLVIIGWRAIPKTASSGALLGAVVGAGFAAFESAGYAFNSLFTAQGLSLETLLRTEALRAILTPVGHVLWTTIFGAVLFGAARGAARYRWSFWILGAYVGVSLLHGLWDSMGGVTAIVALLLTGTTVQDLRFGFIPSGAAQAAAPLASALYVVGEVLITVTGLLTLRRILRHHRIADRPTGRALTAESSPQPGDDAQMRRAES